MITFSLLANKSVHHAQHLADLRKLCAANPTSILRKFKAVRSQLPTEPAPISEFARLEELSQPVADTPTNNSWSGLFGKQKNDNYKA